MGRFQMLWWWKGCFRGSRQKTGGKKARTSDHVTREIRLMPAKGSKRACQNQIKMPGSCASRRPESCTSVLYCLRLMRLGQFVSIRPTSRYKNAFVIQMSGASLVYGDFAGDSSSGFSGTMELADRQQGRYDIVKGVSVTVNRNTTALTCPSQFHAAQRRVHYQAFGVGESPPRVFREAVRRRNGPNDGAGVEEQLHCNPCHSPSGNCGSVRSPWIVTVFSPQPSCVRF